MTGMDAAVQDWSVSGLAALTGVTDSPPDVSRAAVLARARVVATELHSHLR